MSNDLSLRAYESSAAFADFVFEDIYHLSQPAPEDTSTELDPKYRITYLAAPEVAEQPRCSHEQEEAVAAAFAFSQLEASLSGVLTNGSNAEAISRQGMTASTSGTTAATDQGRLWQLKPACQSPCRPCFVIKCIQILSHVLSILPLLCSKCLGCIFCSYTAAITVCA